MKKLTIILLTTVFLFASIQMAMAFERCKVHAGSYYAKYKEYIEEALENVKKGDDDALKLMLEQGKIRQLAGTWTVTPSEVTEDLVRFPVFTTEHQLYTLRRTTECKP